MYTSWSVFDYGVDLLRSVDIWQSLGSTSGDQVSGLCSKGIIAGVVAGVSERDERWKALAKDQLGEVFQKYVAHGDSVLLANLIHITRPLFRLCLEDIQDMAFPLMAILRCISEFDIEQTVPDLQYDFCALWNEITREAHDRGSYHIPVYILSRIRHLYIAYIDAPMPPRPLSMLPHLILGPFYAGHRRTHYAISRAISLSHNGETSNRLTITSDPPDVFLNPSTEPSASSFPASAADHNRVYFVGELSLHGVVDPTLTMNPPTALLP